MSLNPLKYGTASLLLIFLFACGEKENGVKKPIVLGDSSLIVTETDPRFLKNETEDIAPNNHKSKAKQIAQMMVQVDSMKATQKLEEAEVNNAPVTGFTLNFEGFDVIFNNLAAHTSNHAQPDKNASSVSLIKDGGDFQEMKIQLKSISNAVVEEKMVTKLTATINNERFVLQNLGTFSTPWYTLPGKNNLFICTGNNSVQFNEVNNAKIKQGLTAAMQAKRKSISFVKQAQDALKNTRTAIDPPCKIEIYSIQFVVKGTVQGKKVKKLIRFDVPL